MATHWKEKSIRYKITGIPSAPMNELMYLFSFVTHFWFSVSITFYKLESHHAIKTVIAVQYVTSNFLIFLFDRFDLDGNRISVVQYFKKQYNYSLKHVNWPCLQAGSDSRPKYLPMEVSFSFRCSSSQSCYRVDINLLACFFFRSAVYLKDNGIRRS